MFRQDYRINKIFLPFSRPAGQAAERQKASFLFEGRREKNQVNLACPVGPADRTGVNPVRKHFGFMTK